MSNHDEFCINDEKLCIKYKEFCIKNDEFCSAEQKALLEAAERRAQEMGKLAAEQQARLMAERNVAMSAMTNAGRERTIRNVELKGEHDVMDEDGSPYNVSDVPLILLHVAPNVLHFYSLLLTFTQFSFDWTGVLVGGHRIRRWQGHGYVGGG